MKFHANANYTDAEALVEEEENLKKRNLFIHEWSATDASADIERVGLKGSPTKVKKIENVVLTATETKAIPPTEQGISNLVHELIVDHTLG